MEPPHAVSHLTRLIHRISVPVFTALLLCFSASAQVNRITRRIDNAQRVPLPGHILPKANAANDRGRVAPTLQLSLVTLELALSASQQSDLENLLAEQQNPSSATYHRWLTPEQYADRFGASPDDIAKITQWVQSQGLSVSSVARGRDWIAVSGTAAQVETAFATELHQYAVDGETHFANATEPALPAAIADVVKSVRGLNDFRMKPASVKSKSVNPQYTSAHGNHYVVPNDFATLYNVQPAYAAGFDGSGQRVVVAGQAKVDLSDITLFQTAYNLPANPPQLVLVPGSGRVKTDDLAEADLDIQWAGAIARRAAIIYVYSDDVLSSVQYAIDQNLAPVVSMSYGSCELENGTSDARNLQKLAQKGNALGITWFNASGDNGAADCGDRQNPGLSADLPASVPEITAIGGTEFQEGTSQFWALTNDANGASVLSYIPETSWNDSTPGSLSASGGGASVYFPKPSWQAGLGVPSDNARDVPDISANASAEHDPYLIYSGGSIVAIGGTSAPTPAFAGIAALLNQYLVSTGKQAAPGLGNINPHLYSLAQSAPFMFRDITTGNNIVTVTDCACTPTAVGYSAGAGYDSVTGLGSVDVWKLISCWVDGSVCLSLTSNVDTIGLPDSAFLTVTAVSNGGVTPAGVVQFSAGNTALGSATLTGSAGIATATLSVTGAQLPQGTSTVTAAYNGGSTSAAITSTVILNVRTAGSDSTPSLSGLTNGASFQQVYSPGMILAAFGSQLSSATASAGSVPLPSAIAGVAATVNGVSAPLYYVSPTQLNIQIPYQTAAGAATLTINNNGQTTSKTFQVAAASPGIFADQTGAIVPVNSAARGQTTTLYLTGVGAVTPEVATGAAPVSNTPKPLTTAVTVAGIPASLSCQFCYVGIPAGLVGVTQINFQIPAGVPTGPQPVVVTVNGIASAPATINITN